jgi:hypothetical protein
VNSTPATTPAETPTETSQPHDADMLIIPTSGTPYLTRRTEGQSIPQTIARIIQDSTTFGLGILRVWHYDTFTGRAPNPTADWILPHLGYTHPTGWFGPVVLTMEEAPDGQIPPLPPHVVDALITRTS